MTSPGGFWVLKISGVYFCLPRSFSKCSSTKNHHICTRLQVFAKNSFGFNNQIVGKHPSRKRAGFCCARHIMCGLHCQHGSLGEDTWIKVRLVDIFWVVVSNIFDFHPEPWGKWSNLTCAYFSNGLKPPTSYPFSVAGWNFCLFLGSKYLKARTFSKVALNIIKWRAGTVPLYCEYTSPQKSHISWELMVERWHFLWTWSLFRGHSSIFCGGKYVLSGPKILACLIVKLGHCQRWAI